MVGWRESYEEIVISAGLKVVAFCPFGILVWEIRKRDGEEVKGEGKAEGREGEEEGVGHM
jgi:hypothetical protein